MPGFLPSHSWQHNISGGKHNVFSSFLFFPDCLDKFSYLQNPMEMLPLLQLLLVQLQPFHLLLLLQLASSWPCFRPLLRNGFQKADLTTRACTNGCRNTLCKAVDMHCGTVEQLKNYQNLKQSLELKSYSVKGAAFTKWIL